MRSGLGCGIIFIASILMIHRPFLPDGCDDFMTDALTAATPAAIALLPRVSQGRKAVISREELIRAAINLLGASRSVSTLSLREVAREAGIAPNSFYRHFRDIDELAIALIELSGSSLRQIFSQARERAATTGSVVRASVEVFMEQLTAEEGYLPILLREGKVGSVAFRQAVGRQLTFFEDELQRDLLRLNRHLNITVYQPALAAKAITRLVFAMGAVAADLPREEYPRVVEETIIMVRMILAGARVEHTA